MNEQRPDILIRPVRRGDASLIAHARSYMSAETLYRRYHAPKPRISSRELRYLTDVDGRDHVALIAVDRSCDGRMAGITRAIRRQDDPQVADLAVMVCDPYQGRGLGRLLLEQLLCELQLQDVDVLHADVQPDNRTALRLLSGLRPDTVSRFRGGVTELRIPVRQSSSRGSAGQSAGYGRNGNPLSVRT